MNNQEAKLKGKIILKKNNIINKIWHPESTLVFKSSKEKLVIGRLDNKDFIPLDDEALDLCIKWKFKYDNSLVDDEEGEGESDDDNEKSKEDSDSNEESEPVKKTSVVYEKPVKKTSAVNEEPVKKTSAVNEEPVKKTSVINEKPVKETSVINEKPVKETSVVNEEPVKETSVVNEEPVLQVKKSNTQCSNIEEDINLQVEVVFNDMVSSTLLLRKNFQKILDDVQKNATYKQLLLSKELEEVNEEFETLKQSFKSLDQEHEETKCKLAKIRNALGF